ncbi:gamma-glutamylcyclotransferase family protein [Rheinheimera texasensis]|uniref:gamma-glutamylcyclotransferase family protein n=1 Tax=Rheinheimera texasensis TaxID=306205 RepID=UPI001B80DEEA|nr:gamma-glutamylcyclotransferase family protein [Rheinheimera texasensis]
MINRIFVYGTLAPGRPNAHVLGHLDGSWLNATIRGHLVQAGWGAEQGYPGVVIDAKGGVVEGFILSFEGLQHEWQRLDEFEGEQYQRVVTKASLEDGQLVEVYVYQLRR